jgi:hypothetical protein
MLSHVRKGPLLNFVANNTELRLNFVCFNACKEGLMQFLDFAVIL